MFYKKNRVFLILISIRSGGTSGVSTRIAVSSNVELGQKNESKSC